MSIPPLLLASRSPSRQKQLRQLGLTFQCVDHKVDEESYKNRSLKGRDLACLLAQKKVLSVKDKYPLNIILGADQVLSLGSKNFSKAQSEEEARQQLRELAGKRHQLFSAMTLFHPEKGLVHYDEKIHLTMKELTEEQIQRFCATQYSKECLGYQIEKRGLCLFSKIECKDFSAILGLPLLKLNALLSEWGFSIP